MKVNELDMGMNSGLASALRRHEAGEPQPTAPYSPTKTLTFLAAHALVTHVLERPFEREWTVQGFGMLRTYLDHEKTWRLNVWHSSIAVKDVSTVHDHPWDFESLVLAGVFTNVRYHEVSGRDEYLRSRKFKRVRIQTGEGGGIRGEPVDVDLVASPPEHYGPGAVYSQRAEEIHESLYADGTVTLNRRVRRPDGEHANVFYDRDKWWNDAEPRPARSGEVSIVVRHALAKMGLVTR